MDRICGLKGTKSCKPRLLKGPLPPPKVNSRAGLAVAPEVFSSVRYSGVLFVNSTYDNDLVGIIFGYQNHKNFYALTSSMTGSRQVCENKSAHFSIFLLEFQRTLN